MDLKRYKERVKNQWKVNLARKQNAFSKLRKQEKKRNDKYTKG